MNKKCKDCLIEKLSNCFYGLQGECKECTKKRVSDNYKKNFSYYKKYEAERNKSALRKKQRLESQKKQRKNNPQKYLARQQVSRALKKGIITKSNCIICGNDKVEAHHEDHNKPLDIKWLCKRHHLEADRRLKLL